MLAGMGKLRQVVIGELECNVTTWLVVLLPRFLLWYYAACAKYRN